MSVGGCALSNNWFNEETRLTKICFLFLLSDTSAEKMNDIQDLSEAMHTEQLTYLSTQQNAVDRYVYQLVFCVP